eukprot:COSAG01_NODE_1006_length_12163_cov_237.845669_11_plen_115_part_00
MRALSICVGSVDFRLLTSSSSASALLVPLRDCQLQVCRPGHGTYALLAVRHARLRREAAYCNSRGANSLDSFTPLLVTFCLTGFVIERVFNEYSCLYPGAVRDLLLMLYRTDRV